MSYTELVFKKLLIGALSKCEKAITIQNEFPYANELFG